MPSITVSQEVPGDSKTVFKKLQKYWEKKLVLKEAGNFQPKVDWEDGKQKGTFNEKGVQGTIQVSSGSSATITVCLELPFLMMPFKGLIAESVQKHLANIE